MYVQKKKLKYAKKGNVVYLRYFDNLKYIVHVFKEKKKGYSDNISKMNI